MTEKKLVANRDNACKSTGPKTARGKAASSRNAVKHGVLSAAPILPGVESRKAWEEHRDGILKGIDPADYVEKLLAIRLAVISWRLSRVVRYEVEVAAAAVATAEADLQGRAELGFGKPSDPAAAHAKAEAALLIVELLKSLANMTDGEKLETELAVATLWSLWRELPNDIGDISIPGIPEDDSEFNAFNQWTAGLLRKGVEVYAAAARITPESLMNKCISSALKKRDDAVEEEHILVAQGQRWRLLLERENRSRKLLEPNVLDKVARYESNLERSFFRILHEIQRLQASRSGAVIPPPATMDVDLTVHTEGSS